MLIAFFTVIAIVGAYFFIISLINKIWLEKETQDATLTDGPMISVLIPARDEEVHIGPCIESLLSQTYKNYEILVINDNSTDNTKAILEDLENKNPEKLRVFDGKPLAEDWNGKPYALHQLVEHAKGEYLLLTDADTIHSSKSVAIAASNMIYHKVDFLSGYIKQQMGTLGEKVTIPLMYMMSFFIIPLWVCKWGKSSILATAVGQYICIKKDTFIKTGGFEQVKNVTTEDVFLARSMKLQGAKTVFIDLNNAAICRMYNSYKDSLVGISKNIYDFFGRNGILLILAILGVTIYLTLPPFVAIVLTIRHFFFDEIKLLLLICLWIHTILMYFAWYIVFKSQNIQKRYALLYPLFFVNLIFIASNSWFTAISKKGHVWKGRIVH